MATAHLPENKTRYCILLPLYKLMHFTPFHKAYENK